MDKKINVLFDATILVNGTWNSAARSGVYFVAYNILIEMLKRPELHVKLYCSPERMFSVLEVLNSDEKLVNVSCFKYSLLDKLVSYWSLLKYENKLNKGNKIVRVFIKTILNFLKFISDVKNKLNISIDYKNLYKDIDVFFSPWGEVPPEVKNVEHIKKYTILHDVIPLIFPENYPDLKKKGSDLYRAFNSFDKEYYYFSNSEYTKNDFIKYVDNITPENIVPIKLSTGLDYKRVDDRSQLEKIKEKYNIPRGKKYLFSLCTLEPRKNLVFAVKNFIEFIKRNKIEDFVFVLGGGHWDYFIQNLNDTIEDSDDYKDKIIKIGYVNDEDMSALYGGAEMFVFPSIYEGFGMPILEAMQCGCPVITSNVASMPEVIGGCGIQIDPTNDEDLIKAFEKMYFDGQFRQLCSQKGLERAKSFTWGKGVDIIVEEMVKNENN